MTSLSSPLNNDKIKDNNKEKQQTIKTTKEYHDNNVNLVTQKTIDEFQQNGFSIFPNVFDTNSVRALNERLEYVLRGEYDTGTKPDKIPRIVKMPLPSNPPTIIGNINISTGTTCGNVGEGCQTETSHEKISPIATATATATSTKQPKPQGKKKKSCNFGHLGYSGNKKNIKVMQIINIHKSDNLFHQLVTTEILGYIVSKLMKWPHGARLAQDQIWAKPPGATCLAYHRDSPYFMFSPHSVCTVWIALDDMIDDLGPITYVKGSHLWNDGRIGSSQHFFESDGGMDLLYSAAYRSGVVNNIMEDLEFVTMSGLKAGGMSVHDGRTWHGSGDNKTDHPRRGIGLHFVPVNVRWTVDAMKSSLWRRYVEDVVEDSGDVESIEIEDEDFPIVYLDSQKSVGLKQDIMDTS